MKKAIIIAAAVLLSLPVVAQQRKVEGKGEEYHHAMYLNFKHAAEEAEALYNQTGLNRELNLEIARQHVDELWTSLDNARIQHAMVHKTYGEQQSTLVAENHESLLNAHDKALEAGKLLKTEIEKGKPDVKVVREQSVTVYQMAIKAATEHLEGMKKLGIPPMKIAS